MLRDLPEFLSRVFKSAWAWAGIINGLVSFAGRIRDFGPIRFFIRPVFIGVAILCLGRSLLRVYHEQKSEIETLKFQLDVRRHFCHHSRHETARRSPAQPGKPPSGSRDASHRRLGGIHPESISQYCPRTSTTAHRISTETCGVSRRVFQHEMTNCGPDAWWIRHLKRGSVSKKAASLRRAKHYCRCSKSS